MLTLSATDLAIATAIRAKTLNIVECFSERLNEPYFAIEDNFGLIETHLTLEAVNSRIESIEEAI